ncbi:unnamed protein product [Cuscuta epithymum]|uniref:RNase H type-1 domain-containing protein n=1 Tax=Cuscuta epithymum TaxID=186058 RepID=A0AAV0CCX1_9ASTE|nr:unnamed protein product [Cuscuta epithymum]
MTTDPAIGLENSLVNGLLYEPHQVWDIDILHDLFNDRDSKLIQSIPVSRRMVPDRLIWRWESGGRFLVRSCYRRITGECQATGWKGWTGMWNWQLPPKIKSFFWQACNNFLPTTDNLSRQKVECSVKCGLCGSSEESLLHLFVQCSVARACWSSVGWPSVGLPASSFIEWVQRLFQVKRNEELQKIAWVCWSIWCERNERIWKGKKLEAHQFLGKAESFVNAWLQEKDQGKALCIQEQSSKLTWKRPTEGRCKLNVDAGFNDEGCVGGWILRNDHGDFLAGAARYWEGNFSPLEAELMGIREALSWLKDQDWNYVDVESDSLLAISEIRLGSNVSSFGLLAEDIRELSSSFTGIDFHHIRRSANRAAHAIAREVSSMSDCCV